MTRHDSKSQIIPSLVGKVVTQTQTVLSWRSYFIREKEVLEEITVDSEKVSGAHFKKFLRIVYNWRKTIEEEEKKKRRRKRRWRRKGRWRERGRRNMLLDRREGCLEMHFKKKHLEMQRCNVPLWSLEEEGHFSTEFSYLIHNFSSFINMKKMRSGLI